MPGLSSSNQSQQSSNEKIESKESDPGLVKGTYQPVGKVDIAAIRRQAKESGSIKDDRPEIVKGSYEPVGKVDIAAIRAKAQKPSESTISRTTPRVAGHGNDAGEVINPNLDRSAPFSSSERLTSLPKPKIANKFGGTSSYTGTQAPGSGGTLETKSVPGPAPVGTASRTFADQGGKTPAQIWQRRKLVSEGTVDPQRQSLLLIRVRLRFNHRPVAAENGRVVTLANHGRLSKPHTPANPVEAVPNNKNPPKRECRLTKTFLVLPQVA